jgi:alkanesulfonate monooxygenase SsuD/methylene tetrahydromethanopterin reductase-like flavin-dependent oxidoreductase (luciferase family)
LATSFYQLALGMIRNKRRPLPPPLSSMDDLWNEGERAAITHMTQYAFVGSVPTVKTGLQSFLETTAVDEIMITSHIYSLETKIRCYEMVAPLFETNKK